MAWKWKILSWKRIKRYLNYFINCLKLHLCNWQKKYDLLIYVCIFFEFNSSLETLFLCWSAVGTLFLIFWKQLKSLLSLVIDVIFCAPLLLPLGIVFCKLLMRYWMPYVPVLWGLKLVSLMIAGRWNVNYLHNYS